MGECLNPSQPHRIALLSRKGHLRFCEARVGIAMPSAIMNAEQRAFNRSLAQTVTTPDVGTMLASMVRAYAENRSQLRPYVLTRQYVVLKSGKQKSNIIAAIIYLPPEATTFVIRESTGGRAESVVRRLLEKEMQVARNFQAVGFNIANYEFKFLGEEPLGGAQCYVLAIHPRRKSEDLLEGKIWLDKSLYLVRRVQGSPVKSPSWWVKDVSFTADYANLEGMWLQIGSAGEARVRFAGKYKLVSQEIAFALLKPVAPTTIH
jgi:hypothetical protein